MAIVVLGNGHVYNDKGSGRFRDVDFLGQMNYFDWTNNPQWLFEPEGDTRNFTASELEDVAAWLREKNGA